MTLHDLANIGDECFLGKRATEEYRQAIKQYEEENGCDAPDYVYQRLDSIKRQRTHEKFGKMSKIIYGIVGVIVILILFGIIKFGIWLFSDIDSGPDYTTYYNDENGNGKLDRGEGNYTTDEDGNVVDWDEDNNNWE